MNINNDVVIRKAESTDMDLIFNWRNMIDIVALSQSQNTVTWNEHCTWFNDSLSSHQNSIFIVIYKNREVGLCRFERDNRVCELSIYLISEYVQKGIGSVALNKCMQSERGCCAIFRAIVRKENTRSCLFFEKNGFIIKDDSQNVVTYEIES